jgi:hypothetical protein
MIEHLVQWTAPSPLWAAVANASEATVRRTFRQPSILRFASDAFMDQFIAVLEKDPAHLGGLVARPETWRGPTPPPAAESLLEPAVPMSSLARRLHRLRLAKARLQGGAPVVAVPQSNGDGTASPPAPLKLYQAAHQRYYLVSACLVCGVTGLPDRTLDVGHQERAFFVMRRLFPRPGSSLTAAACSLDTCDEYAFVVTPRGSGWQRVPDAGAQLMPGEEPLPLFTVSFPEDDGRKRRLFAGLIPVGKREAYMGAAKASAVTLSTPSFGAPLPKTARKILFRSQVAEPWKNVIQQAFAVRKTVRESDPSPSDEQRDALLRLSHEQLQTSSWYILLDFAAYLQQYMPNVWQAVNDPSQRNALSRSSEQTLFDALRDTTLPQAVIDELVRPVLNAQGDNINLYTAAHVPTSLRDALTDRLDTAWKAKLETVTGAYDRLRPDPKQSGTPDPRWPTFLFPLADLFVPGPGPLPNVAGPWLANGITPLGPDDGVEPDVAFQEHNGLVDPDAAAKQAALASVDKLVALVVRALPTQATEPEPPLPLAAQPVADTGEGMFVIRCVFERPNCGPLEPPVVSDPTQPFQLAGFFDPDAPARPIRIALPIDTSPAGLRKFDKNTAFMISDMLCGQIARVRGLTLGDLVRSVLPWPFHKDLSVPDTGPCTDSGGAQVGMMCSLSIPIITICALLLLMIIVSLLNIIFHWVPYFLMCFPLPGFKGKR